MAGVRVGVYKGSSHAKFVETKVPDTIPVYYSNNDQMLLDLKAGRIDVVFGDKINWQLLLIETEDGKDWKDSGTTQSGLTSREHLIEGKLIHGWATPPATSVIIAPGITDISLTYQACDDDTSLSVTRVGGGPYSQDCRKRH